MSQKQKEHKENYHMADLNINDDDKDTTDVLKNTVWEDLADYRKRLSIYDPDVIKLFIKHNLRDDVIKITDMFDEEFKDIPNDDILKREVMILLGELGITIYKKQVTDNLDYLG
jgi:hypothetical protein